MTDVSKEPSRSPRPSHQPRWLSLGIVVVALLLALQHIDWRPRVQAVAYEGASGEITYGLRLSVKGAGDRERWTAELGKISDDSLRERIIDGNAGVGVGDSWFYLRVNTGEEAHLLLASLWQANLISRAEAEAVVGRGPGQLSETLAPVIHRVPSVATLTAAYAAGAHAGTRVILGMESKPAKALVGAASVGGAVVVFSRSSRMSQPKQEQVLFATASAQNGFAVSAWERRDVEVNRVRVLSPEERKTSPFAASSPWSSSFGVAFAGDSLPQDWLEQAASHLTMH